MKLLIVDDSNIMRRAIEKYVKDFKLDLIGTAGDGEQALALFKTHSPDVVTLDITMPKLDGISCLKEMMKINPRCRVLIISALKDPATSLSALKYGAKGFLPKPFTELQLKEEILELLGDTK
ncbi:MAG: response regulator receiver protein [Spirochaetes bacterium GWF1_31_7]|nr:MAG: response regulator receiver protein [Spirochaetes bacterium GWE1_32_154]OHD47253.1 MAG: response regulator receiver protein [Spirochaetes bacterium GWE2_31_10]OHD52125.1 MAG: response regulator receiver protein [Spirochaetes bacterium GWF1_31_7]OHD77670.1 MAG: response regulator receiver protein [Spirochaetes bacterium RIFOXYB1_FULL_32_8]HBD96309.1 response regulator [Spirochaetia bacterium]